MHLFYQISARAIPAILVAGAGYLGWSYVKNKKVEPTKKAQTQKNSSKKKRQPSDKKSPSSSKVRGLKTEFLEFDKTDYQILLHTQGIVKAPQATSLMAQVNGRINQLNPQFASGSFVKKGDTLASIDSADFKTAVISSEASLARATADLAQEQARGEQALRNWKDIGFKEKPNDLVLRKPQLREAEANVRSAEAALARAKRNLTRCNVLAPFSGVIRNRSIGLGTVIGGNTKLGEILATDYAEVRLPLTADQIDQLTESGNLKPTVTFSSALQKSANKTWTGKIVRSEGEMDLSSRELFLIARIEDPFSLKETHQTPLTFNQPVLASMPASVIKDVYVINREHVQGLSEVVTVRNNRVNRLKLSPLWQDSQCIVVSAESIPKDAVLAISPLNYAAEGAKITLIDENGEAIERSKPKSSKKNMGTANLNQK